MKISVSASGTFHKLMMRVMSWVFFSFYSNPYLFYKLKERNISESTKKKPEISPRLFPSLSSQNLFLFQLFNPFHQNFDGGLLIGYLFFQCNLFAIQSLYTGKQ